MAGPSDLRTKCTRSAARTARGALGVLVLLLLVSTGEAKTPDPFPLAVDASAQPFIDAYGMHVDVRVEGALDGVEDIGYAFGFGWADRRGPDDGPQFHIERGDSIEYREEAVFLTHVEGGPPPLPFPAPGTNEPVGSTMVKAMRGAPGAGLVLATARPPGAVVAFRGPPASLSIEEAMEGAFPRPGLPSCDDGHHRPVHEDELGRRFRPATAAPGIPMPFPEDIVWGQAREIRPRPGEEALIRETLGLASGEALPPDVRAYVKFWTTKGGDDDAVVVPIGTSYTPPSPGTTTMTSEPPLAGGRGLWALGAGLAFVCGTIGYTAHPRHRDWDFPVPVPWPLLWLFTRLHRSRLLDHDKRRALFDLIEADPGVRYRDLKDRSGLAAGVLSHHLRMMAEHDLVLMQRRGRRLHVYPKGASLTPHAGDLSDRQASIVAILQKVPQTQAALAAHLGLTQQAVSYHLRNLCSGGLVGRTRGPGGAWLYAVAAPPTQTLVPRPPVRSAGLA